MKIQAAIITIAIVIMVFVSITVFSTLSFALRTNNTHIQSTANTTSAKTVPSHTYVTTKNPIALQCSSADENDVEFLWKHVYDVKNGLPWGRDPGRLTPKTPDCIAVTGTVYSTTGVGKGTFDDPDGDLQFTLALDPPYTKYSAPNDCNPSKTGCTNIIVEVLCHKDPTSSYKTQWGDYCNGVHSVYPQGQFPKQGDKLTVYGKFVFDTDGRWNEIHPATAIIR